MSMDSVRAAFTAAAGPALRLDQAGLVYEGSRQKLTLTGWHADGTPFALVTAPFDGSPVARGIQAARDLIATHSSSGGGSGETEAPNKASENSDRLPTQAGSGFVRATPHPPDTIREGLAMSQKGSGLARLMGGLRDADTKADALATRLESALGSLTAEMTTTEQIVGNVESSVNDLKSVNALYSNGAASPTAGS